LKALNLILTVIRMKSAETSTQAVRNPEHSVGEFFLQRTLSLLESEFRDKIRMERTIKKKEMYQALGRQFSIPKKEIRSLLKALSNHSPKVELSSQGVRIDD